MSVESAAQFLQQLEQDATLREEWRAVATRALGEAMIRTGAGHGLRFSADDLERAFVEREHALSEADLAKVAGGLNPQPEPPAPLYDFRRLINLTVPLPGPAGPDIPRPTSR